MSLLNQVPKTMARDVFFTLGFSRQFCTVLAELKSSTHRAIQKKNDLGSLGFLEVVGVKKGVLG